MLICIALVWSAHGGPFMLDANFINLVESSEYPNKDFGEETEDVRHLIRLFTSTRDWSRLQSGG